MVEQHVAIVMTTYNSQDFVSNQLDSIVKQTYKKWNLYISDDASTDGTIDILKRYATEYNNIKYITNVKNSGLTKNFERALTLVQQEDIIFCCDSDDIWETDKLIRQLSFMQSGELLTHHDARLIDATGKEIEPSLWKRLQKNQISEHDIKNPTLETLIEKNSITAPTIAFNRRLLNDIIPLPKGVVQDRWISLVAAVSGNIITIENRLIMYRQHQHGLQGASTRNFVYYLKRIFSRRFNDSFRIEATDNLVMLERLIGISNTSFSRDILEKRELQYKITQRILSRNKSNVIQIISIMLMISKIRNQYYKKILYFLLISSLFEIRN